YSEELAAKVDDLLQPPAESPGKSAPQVEGPTQPAATQPRP
ncbi:MAG: hypothetical protein JWO31_3980, partial [Phycisphaerales bacterium]|nr:hypothetical protein [Phycisphaerales bacterium]